MSTISPLFSWRSVIVESDLAPTAKHVALTLSLHMSERGDSCFPSLTTLQEETGRGRATICEALKQIEAAGFLRREVGDRRRSTRYFATVPSGSETDHSGSETGHEDVKEHVKEDQDPAPAARARARNLVWDCLVSVTGFDPSSRSEAQDFGKTVAEIRAVIPQDATEAQIRLAMSKRRQAFERLFPGATFTHRVLRVKWGELGHAVGQRSVASMYPELEDEEA